MFPRDDDTSSTASYEDIGRRNRMYPNKEELATIPGKRTLGPDEMPEILYTAEYCSSTGKVLESRQSTKPFESLVWDSNAKDNDGKTPVIEIVARISVASSSGQFNQSIMPPRNRYYSDEEDDDYIPPEMNDTRRPFRTEMIIHSKFLRAALTAVIGYYPGFERLGESQHIEAPYQVLVHHREALEHFKLNQPSCHSAEYANTTAKHIDVLLGFLAETYSEQLALEARRWDNPSGATATYDLFWVLLKPGEIVYKERHGCMVPFVISSATKMVGSDGRQTGYLIFLWNVTWSDSRLKRKMIQTIVPPWTGERVIDALPVVPARFLPGGAKKAAEEQVRLGRAYWELAKQPAYKEYDGPLGFKDGQKGGKITGRVIVDCEGYVCFGDAGPQRTGIHGGYPPPRPRRGSRGPKEDQLPQIEPRCSCEACCQAGLKQGPSPWAGFDNGDPKNGNLPQNEDLYFHIIGPTIPAFILSERRWAEILVSGLSEVKPDQDAFKYLVLDPEIKLTVKAMIGKFASLDGKLTPWPSDFVKNKGEGRIFLLHGSPGVGKTCTAECAAELARRPLLALTSGDISTSMSASAVEGALDYFLKLGERFGALVLLDEADVYLEQRRTRDLRRNGLVSVFLRALEYYKGVLFLTTNRVEAFDDAFTSRIHVTLHYRRLGDEDRAKIWMHNFERLERESNNKVFIPQSTKEFAADSPAMRALRWNGREIRNALQTAVALAETEALDDGLETITVQDRHLRAVVRMSSGFKSFLNKRRAAVAQGLDGDDNEDEGKETFRCGRAMLVNDDYEEDGEGADDESEERRREKHGAEDQDECQLVKNHQAELALLEQQNKKRLMMAIKDYDDFMAAEAETHKDVI